MSKNINAVEFKTKLNKDADAITTKATVSWDGVTEDELKTLALRSLVIDQQAIYRVSGVIPATDNISIRALIDAPKGTGGFKPTPENMAARISKMSKEDFQKSLELLGLDAKQVSKMVAAKYPAEPVQQ